MTLSVRERIALLQSSGLGLSIETMAAIIGLDVADVAAVQANPAINPPSPEGGGDLGVYTDNMELSARLVRPNVVFAKADELGDDIVIGDFPAGIDGSEPAVLVQVPTPHPTFRFTAAIGAAGDPGATVGNGVDLTAPDEASISATSAPTVMVPGVGNGFRASVRTPSFSAGTATASVRLWVANADGSVLAIMTNPTLGLAEGGGTCDFSEEGWTVEAAGDLSVNGETIDSTAGLAYMACMVVQFTTSGLVP